MACRKIIRGQIFANLIAFLLLVACHEGGVNGFCIPGNQGSRRHQSLYQYTIRIRANNNQQITTRNGATQVFLVSEDDVIEAVERAETLWAEALEARKNANVLIDRAEEEANASAGTAKEAENIFLDKTKPVSMEQLVQVDNAAKASLEATSLVNEAMKASEEADKLESKAEEALRKSEEILDQHLIDYPNSSLAD